MSNPNQQQQQQHEHEAPKTYTLTTYSISYMKPSPLQLLHPLTPRPAPSSILHKISFTAYPSQLLAIVGPSGAGKSTLLEILSARTSPSSDHLLLNSTPLRPFLFHRIFSHIPQHDLYLPLLTVSETFIFTTFLLLPFLHLLHHLLPPLLSTSPTPFSPPPSPAANATTSPSALASSPTFPFSSSTNPPPASTAPPPSSPLALRSLSLSHHCTIFFSLLIL